MHISQTEFRSSFPSRWVDLHERTTETAAGSEVLSLEDAKTHLRVEHSGDNSEITSLISEAAGTIEKQSGYTLRVNAKFRTTLRYWPPNRVYRLPRHPVVSVDQIRYYNSDNALTVLGSSGWRLIGSNSGVGGVADIELDQGLDIPGLYDRLDAVQIDYTAGVSAAVNADVSLVRALKIQLDILWDDDMDPSVLKSYERSRDAILANMEQ